MKRKIFLIVLILLVFTCIIINLDKKINPVDGQNIIGPLEGQTNSSSAIFTSTNLSPTSNNISYQYQSPQTFIHGIVIHLDDVGYYFEGPADGVNGAKDAPGHYWWQDSSNHLYGLHYNVGPFGKEGWWSSDAKSNKLLYLVDVIIAPWTNTTAFEFAKQGYVHYHELVKTDNGEKHPELVAWFKHVAIPSSFMLDKGPMPEDKHTVSEGIDYKFLNNYFVPYDPKASHVDYE